MKVLENHQIAYSICVSGASEGQTVKIDAELARSVGREIASAGQTLLTGATVGLPYYAATGASQAGGKSIGFSPAVSLREHLKKYHLPFHCFDFINFTGMNYVGRDLYLVQSSDAIITIGGRFGSLHEFTSALESKKPCGVLLGSGGAADLIPELMKKLEPPRRELVIYSHDPKEIVSKLIEILDAKNKDLFDLLENYDEHWYLDSKTKSIHTG